MKIKYNIGIVFILLSVLIWSTGCRKFPFIEGNGNVVKEIRPSVSFNRIDNRGEFNVYYIPDTIFRVEIEAESNLIPHIRTTINGNVLEIDSRENLNSNYAMKVTVYSPVLAGVDLSGSGLINVHNAASGTFDVILSGSGSIYGDVNTGLFTSKLSGSGEIDFSMIADNAKVIISGSGNISLTGQCIAGEYKISGSGNIKSFNLPLTNCNAKISGSGNIYTTVSDILDVKISGSGNLYYIGNPIINSNITGSGSVIKE